MQFLLMAKSSATVESGTPPTDELVAAVGKYNDELTSAGVLVSIVGITPSTSGARVSFSGTERTVTDGPFPNPEQLIAGFWIIDVAGKADAVEWARRVPFAEGEVEVRELL
jgi:hypothetical protein